jgi:hypothetical protein
MVEFRLTSKFPDATDSNAERKWRIGLEKYNANSEAKIKLAIVAAIIEGHGNNLLGGILRAGKPSGVDEYNK